MFELTPKETSSSPTRREKSLSRSDTVDTATSQSLPFSPHTVSASEVLEALFTDAERGLSLQDVSRRLEVYGPNQLKLPKRPRIWNVLLRQVGNAMTVVLIAAMATSFGTMDWISGGVIAALVILNVTVGTYTEWQAEKTVASLESVGAPRANVIRHDPSTGAKVTSEISVEEVVPGDIIILRTGDIVPADARVLEEQFSNLECDEAFLTGESLPVAKQSEALSEEECPVGDRTCVVFAGSQVTKGRCRAVVFSTGMKTQIGKIATALAAKRDRQLSGTSMYWHKFKVVLGLSETTPLQIKLNKLAYILLGAAVIIAIVVVASTGFKNVPLTVATYAVAAAVSILPASLIAVVSLTLANASTALAKRNALVRRMDAIEALAGVENVCSDKTGTLTVGRMVVRKLWIPNSGNNDPRMSGESSNLGDLIAIETGTDPFFPRGEIRRDQHRRRDVPERAPYRQQSQDEVDDEEAIVRVDELPLALRRLGLCASLCNQATLRRPQEEAQQWEAHGDPTEVALQVAAHKLGLGKPFLTHVKNPLARMYSAVSGNSRPPVAGVDGHYEQILEHSFDSTIKLMSIAYTFKPHNGGKDRIECFLKGAVERVLDRCSTVEGRPLLEEDRRNIMSKMDALAAQGLRVLALGSKPVENGGPEAIKSMSRSEFERDFEFLGLAGIFDPPRQESAGAIADCLRAGITPRMLTGDHPATATAIALSIGLLGKTYSTNSVMTGQQFDAMSIEEIDQLPELPLVIARCAPETKVRMVDAIHRRGETTVMTGDGVNDAPSLKRADVGVGMGSGSDVAKQSSNLVLADDNFATICRAIRKGRSVFKNLSKFLLYLLSGNLAEILVLLIGLAFQDDNHQAVFPLSPVAALWINTLTAGPPALALGLEPTAVDAMVQPPESFQRIFTLEFYADLVFYGILMGALALANFVIVLWGYFPGDLGRYCNELDDPVCGPVFQARAACFATLVIILMIHGLECKHVTKSMFRLDLLDNKILLWCILVLTLSTFPVVYIPVINNKVFLIGSLKWEWGIVFGMILVYMISTEAYKWCKRILFRRSERVSRSDRSPTDKTLRMAPTMREIA